MSGKFLGLMFFGAVFVAVIAIAAFFFMPQQSTNKTQQDVLGDAREYTVNEPTSNPLIARAEFTHVDLAGVGRIPQLSLVIKKNKDLGARVDKVCGYGALYVFENVKSVDREIVQLLLLWSGVDVDARVTQKTVEGLHPHIDHFIREAYALNDDEVIVNNPLVGDGAWLNLFQRYKAHLLAQCMAGEGVFDGEVYYDPMRARLYIDGVISKSFVETFKTAVAQKEEQKLYTNNFLAFVNSTKGLDNLSGTELELLQF